MKSLFYVLLLHCVSLIFVTCGYLVKDLKFDPFSVYYNVENRKPFRVTSVENILTNRPSNEHLSTKTGGVPRRIGFRSNGCTCQELTCGCCAGINLNQFNFNREGCMNFTYSPEDFSVDMNMFLDGNSIYTNSFSAKNPPPLCLPVPIPYVPLSVEACAKLYDIYMPGQNLHMCFDFETHVQQATVLILHFDCMRMGNDGLALLKPGDVGTPPTVTESQVDSDIYDQVTEVKH